MRPISSCWIVLLLIGLAPTVQAQARLVPYAGYAFHAGLDMEQVFSDPRPLDATGGVLVGLGAELPLLAGRFPFALKVRPTAEFVFVPGATDTFEGFGSVDITQRMWQVGATFLAEFSVPGAPVTPFAGIGVAYARYAARFEEAGDVQVVGNTNVNAWALGPALVGGARFGAGRFVPLVQARYSFTNPSPSFGATTVGSEIGNGITVSAGISVGL